jgi:hypothetical protein
MSDVWGHVIRLPQHAGGGIRLVDRTDNALESFFGSMKHGERRRSGRKILTQDFERLPPAAALVPNLSCLDYVAILCGDLCRLPHAFAQLDADKQQKAFAGAAVPAPATTSDSPTPIASASLPLAERSIVRSEAKQPRLSSAARSRSARTAPGRQATAE